MKEFGQRQTVRDVIVAGGGVSVLWLPSRPAVWGADVLILEEGAYLAGADRMRRWTHDDVSRRRKG